MFWGKLQFSAMVLFGAGASFGIKEPAILSQDDFFSGWNLEQSCLTRSVPVEKLIAAAEMVVEKCFQAAGEFWKSFGSQRQVGKRSRSAFFLEHGRIIEVQENVGRREQQQKSKC